MSDEEVPTPKPPPGLDEAAIKVEALAEALVVSQIEELSDEADSLNNEAMELSAELDEARSKLREHEEATQIREKLAGRVEGYDKARFVLGCVAMLLGGGAFLGCLWVMGTAVLKMGTDGDGKGLFGLELMMVSAAVFAGACFAMAARMTTRESTLIGLKSESQDTKDMRDRLLSLGQDAVKSAVEKGLN